MAGRNIRRQWLGAGMLFVAGLAVLPWSAAARRAGPVEVLEFNIEPVPGDTVASDGRISSDDWQYADYRMSANHDCVEASRGGGSLGFITLNRLADGLRCDTNPQPAGGNSLSRQWMITIADPTACETLAAYDSRYVSPSPFVSGAYQSGPCTLTGSDLPRIRIDNLLSSKLPATSAVDFLLKSFVPTSPGYEIRSATKAQVLGAGDIRTVSYGGMARLWAITPKYAPVSGEFPMSVHISLQRTRL
jgi:hypothetical protein